MIESDTDLATGSTGWCLACMLPMRDATVCPHCGTSPSKVPWEYPHLRPGTRVHGRYLIGRALGKGGFAITYLALQEGLNRRVAIKEYFPADVAERGTDATTVRIRRTSSDETETTECFRRGVDRFLEEGQNIVLCHQPNPHPNLVRVTDFFEENGTAYLVMDYVEGVSLETHLQAQPRKRLDERQVRKLMLPVLDGLIAVHKHGFLHRDVKPANIYISKDGTVTLLDFGSARQALSNERRTLTVTLTPGYAPPEQYSSEGGQGPWTDVYGVAATFYRCITGERPPSALNRISNPNVILPSTFPEVRINGRIEKAIMAGLELDHTVRIQSAEEFHHILGGRRSEMLYEAVAMSGLLRNPRRLFTTLLALVAVFAVVALATTSARLLWSQLNNSETAQQKTPAEKRAPEQAEAPRPAGNAPSNPVVPKVRRDGAKEAALNAGQAAMAVRSGLDTSWVVKQGGEAYKAAVYLYTDGEKALEAGRYADARTAYDDSADSFAGIILADKTASSHPQAAMSAIREKVERLRAEVKRGTTQSAAPAQTTLGEQLFNQAAAEPNPNKSVDLYRQSSEIFSKLVPERDGGARSSAEQHKKAEDSEKTQKTPIVDPSIPVQEVDLGEGVTFQMVRVPTGEFAMGSPPTEAMRQEDEGPQRPVRITKGFWMGRFEVTVAQFTRFVQQTGYRTTAEYAGGAWNITDELKQEWKKGLNWKKSDYNQVPDAPVVLISWDDAQAFCHWLSQATRRAFRLPTEAEWEYACRAGTTTAFQWGNDAEGGAGWLNGADEKLRAKHPEWRTFPFSDGNLYAAKVGSYRGNAWGLHDMHGNVWEWVQDWYNPTYYATGPAADPFNGQMDRFHVARGGSWLCYPGFCRSAVRRKYAPEYTTCDLGFRVVMAE